jgi:hypothetical protein
MTVGIDHLVIALYAFGRSLLGIVFRPYETYRRIVRDGSIWELVYLACVLMLYFAVAAAIKTSLFRPFLLTRHVVALGTVVAVTTLLVAGAIYVAGRMAGGNGGFRQFLVGWAYTLVPTVCWFLATSILYVLIPPPRTARPAGIAFSGLFLLFSVVMLLWKIILSYLAVRFGLRLSLSRILLTVLMAGPVVALYSYTMFRLGIFRVPFI